MNRREGFQAAAMTALGYSRVLGANDRIRVALVGCGNRGVNALLKEALRMDDVQMVAACDVYQPNLDEALDNIKQAGGQADGYGDYRKVTERKDVDVVMIATPDHWHAPIVAASCEAGKDVYVEKPLANTIEDCQLAVSAAKKYNRLVQLGAQQRSMRIYREALAMIQDGQIGGVVRCTMVWGGDGSTRPREADQESDPPADLDWEMFQGPAPRRPYKRGRQRGWRGYWEYGSGVITDFGVHLLDVTHWFMGIDQPLSCYGAGYHTPSRPEELVPDVVTLTWKYENFMATYMGIPETWGNRFWGDQGWLHVNRQTIRLQRRGERRSQTPPMQEIPSPEPGGGEREHLRNLLDCTRSRQRPNLDVETGFRSTVPCLLAALSVRTGKAYCWDWPSQSVQEV